MTNLFRQIVRNRFFSEQFLKPKYEECLDPFFLPDVEQAVLRIKQARDKKEKVLIYGDYDVDGVTSSTLIYDALELVGIKEKEIMLPNRFSDGYGMSKKVVQVAVEKEVGLVLTVDCGSGNGEIIEELKKKGIDTIVTDHHECPSVYPKPVAFINPKRKEVKDRNLKDLAGVGVAFKLAQALSERKLIKKGQEKWLLDLVLIGTLCDSMRISEENRRLCYYGMKVLKKTRRVGLKELIRISGDEKINSETIGFRIGPRLNASGRMTTAEKSLSLLMEKSGAKASKMAVELNDLNEKRRKEQDRAVKEILEREDFSKRDVIVVRGKWHEGVIGIVAGKLVEIFKKPAIVFSEKGEELKGSGRSFGEFDLTKALEECREEIISGGGHSLACGVKVREENFGKFDRKINKFYKSLNLTNQERFLEEIEDLKVDDFKDFSFEFLEELSELEPFGEGNREPIFLLESVLVLSVKKMGKKEDHLSIFVLDKNGESLKLVSFFAPEEWKEVSEGERISVWIRILENEWNGRKSIEGRIVKMRLDKEGNF